MMHWHRGAAKLAAAVFTTCIESAPGPGVIARASNGRNECAGGCACRDNYRPFFEQVFPKLLGRVFGFDGVCWLSHLARSGTFNDATALLDLLSPTGAAGPSHVAHVAGCSIWLPCPSIDVPKNVW